LRQPLSLLQQLPMYNIVVVFDAVAGDFSAATILMIIAVVNAYCPRQIERRRVIVRIWMNGWGRKKL